MFIAKMPFSEIPSFGVIEGVGVGVSDNDASCRIHGLIEGVESHEFNLHGVESCK